MVKKRNIAAFDFDGTLTVRDSFPAFMRFATGTWRALAGFLLYSPLLVLMKLRLYPNDVVKERLFSFFFKGWEYERFQALGQAFADEIEKMRNDKVIGRLQEHISRGDTVYIVSASIREWVEPWCLKMGANTVIATEVEVGDDNRLTGRFKTPNCNGEEKVKRLLQVEPQRDSYHLAAYGDSRGDEPLLALADTGTRIKN